MINILYKIAHLQLALKEIDSKFKELFSKFNAWQKAASLMLSKERSLLPGRERHH